MQYQVVRQHYGDKQYFDGDVRVVDNDDDAEALMAMGLIAPLDDGKGQKRPVKNKADPKSGHETE